MLLHPFKTGSGFYLYSAWSNRIVRISGELYTFFSGSASKELKTETARTYGLLPLVHPEISVYDPALIAAAITDLQRAGAEMLVLSITEACNCRCEYCSYSGAFMDARRHSHRSMSSDTAAKAIDWYFSFERNEFRIGFYGGEPLLQFPLIKKTVAYARRHKPPDTRLVFALTTNGLALDPEVQKFLSDERFETFISLDGPEHIHNRYRKDCSGKGTFERIWNNLKAFSQYHPDYFNDLVNFTITVAPPDPLEDIRVFMIEHPDIFGSKIPKVSAVKVPANASADCFINEAVDYSPLRASYAEACARGEMPDNLTRSLIEASMRQIHRRFMTEISRLSTTGGQCTPGRRCFVDAEGKFHMCERVNRHFPIGSVESGFDFDEITSCLERFAALTTLQCRNCWAVRLCRKCIPMLAEGGELTGAGLDRFCTRQKQTLEASLSAYSNAREKNVDCFDHLR